MEIFDDFAILYICVACIYIIHKIYISSQKGWDTTAKPIIGIMILSVLLYLTIK